MTFKTKPGRPNFRNAPARYNSTKQSSKADLPSCSKADDGIKEEQDSNDYKHPKR